MFSHKACNPIQLFICYISIKKELIWTAMNYKGLGLTCGHTQLMAQVTAGIGLWIDLLDPRDLVGPIYIIDIQ